jgi:hypothetical protein
MNSNALHNILNVAIAVLGAIATFDWSQFIGTTLAVKLMAGLALAKLVINAFRDGVAGMVKPQ